MFHIDAQILNKALKHPGLVNRYQLEMVHKLDEIRRRNPFVRLTSHERAVLKQIGRRPGIDIYPESFGMAGEGDPPGDPVSIHGLEDRESDLGQALQQRREIFS